MLKQIGKTVIVFIANNAYKQRLGQFPPLFIMLPLFISFFFLVPIISYFYRYCVLLDSFVILS